MEMGIKANGVILNTIRYADDILILCDSLEGLEQLADIISQAGQELGLCINVRKTKLMIFSRDQCEDEQLTLMYRYNEFIASNS